MQGMFEGGFQGEKRHLLPLLSKLRPTCGFVFKLVELPRDWEKLADGDWAVVRFKSEDSGNIGYVAGPMFADLGVYMLKIEGFVCISYLDYPRAKSYTYSGYDTLEYKSVNRKSDISAAIKHSEKAMGHPSLLSKEAGRYNGRRNADKLIPGEVLPPCVETESRFLIKNGVLMQYLGHEEEVTIPDTCTSIGVRAFKDQTQLRRVVVPKSVKDIGESAFEGCTALEQIELTKGLKKIGRDAFSQTALTHIDLPDGLTGMEWSSLGGVSLRIPASLKKIDEGILPNLAWVEVAPKNPVYTSHNGAIYRREDAALLGVPQDVSGVFEIPEGVKKVGDSAFVRRRELTGVRFPAGITELGKNAFLWCEKLETLDLPEGLTTIGWNTFSFCRELRKVRFPEGLTTIGQYACSNCEQLREVRLPSTLKEIEHGAFRPLKKLERLDIPDGVTRLDRDAFEETTVLAADLAVTPVRELLQSRMTIELSVTPGRDYTNMVTPAVLMYFTERNDVEAFTILEPFAQELWDWLPDLIHYARDYGAAEMEAHLLALEEAGLAQGKKRRPL